MSSGTGRARGACLLALGLFLMFGCQNQHLPADLPSFAPPPTPATNETSDLQPDPPLALVVTPRPGSGRLPPATHLDVALTVLHVQIPRTERDRAATLWNHLREDALDHATRLRLRHNGLRVGVGHRHWWDAVKATLDAIEGVVATTLDPVRLPADYPLALELDSRAREQTLFYVEEDGILSGATWPRSRNVLRVQYGLDLDDPRRLSVGVVPEVRQRLAGWRWIRNEAGITQLPNYNGQTFSAAGFVMNLDPGEFLLIAPGERAELYGILGGAFLVRDQDGTRYDSYVFLRADVNHVALRH